MVALSHEDGGNGPFITNESALLAAIVQSAADAIIGLDLRGTVLSWNAAATALYGHAPGDMLGRSINRVIPYDRRRDLDEFLERVRTGERLPQFEAVHLSPRGDEFAVLVTLSPVFDQTGAVIAAALFAHARFAAARQPTLDPVLAANAARSRRILVVEDEPLIGFGLAAMLGAAGFEVIGPANTLGRAMLLLESHDCALAILDINLGGGETSAPIAKRLKADGIPFFVTSGYLNEVHPAIFGDVPSFAKPVRSRTLVAAVQDALGAA